MKNENELLIPPAAEEDPKAMEVIGAGWRKTAST